MALERPGVEFKIFQFPPDKIPTIDGKTQDWNIVPEAYVIGSDQLKDTVNNTPRDPKDLDVRVKAGWVKGLNRLYFLYEAYANQEHYQQAIDAYALQKGLDGETPAALDAIKDGYATGGWPGFLRQRIAALEAQAQPIPEEVASFHARLGSVEAAMAWLEKSYLRRSPRLALLKVDPRYDNLRGDPRFSELLGRVGLAEEHK